MQTSNRPAIAGGGEGGRASTVPANAALGRAVAPHLTRLLAVAERILGCPDEARDAVQEALVTLWETADVPENLRAWLVRTVVHRSLHRRRGAERRRKWEERAAVEMSTWCALCDPERSAEGAELRGQLESALRALSEEQQIVIALRALHGLDYQAIAAELGVPVGTVRSRLNRARAALREELARWT
jgi:RNA polymerase sigma-70 factor (ECF subfamily)